jgi:long-chain acyl-CoA synthetase
MSAVPGTIEHWAAERPDEVAIVEGDRELTYRQWNEAADRVAYGLAERGVGSDDIVVLRTQIRTEWAVLSSALAKLGASLLGLNWRLTPSETQYVLSNSRATAIVCDDPDPSALAPAFVGLPIKLAVSLDADADGFDRYAELLQSERKEPLFAAGDPPLIIYTSGTTGLPKGVPLRSGRTADMSPKMLEYLIDVAGGGGSAAARPVESRSVSLVTMPMHHGAGPGQMWGARRGGSKIVLLRRFDPEKTLELIQEHRVTHWTGVPTMYKRIAALPPEVVKRYDVSSIRALGVGAAPVPYSLKTWILDTFGEDVLSEGYGATETGMISRLPGNMQRKKPGSSGLPHKHVEIEIRDPVGRVLPTGQEGEIWVKTPVTIGRYLNGKDLDSDTLDTRGFFRVGDVGKVDDEGYLFITDRAKDMIISGGVNIYPAEVEAAILLHPSIQDVAVIGIPDEEFGEQVKAFCELKPGRMANEAQILEHCREKLASYKRPKSVDFVNELPRNTMGKLLKRELRQPYWKDRERNV